MSFSELLQLGKLGFARGIGVLLVLYIQVWVLNEFGANKYGEFVFFITVCSFVAIISKGGLDIFGVRLVAIALDKGNVGEIFAITKKTIRLSWLYSSVGVFLSWSIYKILEINTVQIPSLSWELIIITTASLVTFQVMSGFVRGLNKNLLADWVESAIRPLLWLGCCAIAVGLNLNHSVALSISYAISFASAALIFHFFTKNIEFEKYCVVNIGYAFRDHLYFVSIGLIGFVYFQLDTLLLGIHVPPSELGAYNMACNLVRIIIFVPMIIGTILQPRIAVAISNGDNEKLIKLTINALALSGAFSIASFLFLLFTGKYVLEWINPTFGSVANAMYILSLAHVINSQLIVIGAIYSISGKYRQMIYAQIFGCIVTIVGYLLLVPYFRDSGAAISVLVGLSVNLITITYLSRQQIRNIYEFLLRKT
jgi:O-antigen/teichoic acid export membrane protein